jgi:hypothetical protein
VLALWAQDVRRDALVLPNREIKRDDNANDRYGAFKVGTHDDTVTALGLAVVEGPQRVEIFEVDSPGGRGRRRVPGGQPMAATGDYTQVRTDTTSPEVAKLLIAHNLAMRASVEHSIPNVDKYLEVFDRVYKAISATTQVPVTVA